MKRYILLFISALVLLGLILCQTLEKNFSVLLCMGISVMILVAGISFFRPVVAFLEALQSLCNLRSDMLLILLKVTFVCIITEISALLCVDGGNASLAQSLKLLSSVVALWLSIPVFRALLDLLQRILVKRNKEILVRLALKNKFPPEKVLPLEKEIAESGKDIADFLQENNLCTEAEFFNVIADMFCVPFSEMPVLEVDKTLLETFDNSFLRKNNIVPVCILGSKKPKNVVMLGYFRMSKLQ